MSIRKNIQKKISVIFAVAVISMIIGPVSSANVFAAEISTPSETTEIQSVEVEEPSTIMESDELVPVDGEQHTDGSADKSDPIVGEADNLEPESEGKVDEEVPSVPSICEDEAVNSSANLNAASATKVATVYIISYKGSAGSSWSTDGHTFLAIRNDSDSKIAIGHYNLSAGSIMTVGTWGNISDGKYAYYNIEKYRMVNGVFSYTPNVYYRASVTSSQIGKLTNAINDNYTWSTNKNCSRFARYCWNSMFSSSSAYHIDASSTVETPTQMYSKISKMSGHSTSFKFGSSRTCTMDYVYRHTASGKASLSTAAKKDVKL